MALSLADRVQHASLLDLSADTLRRIGLDPSAIRPLNLLSREMGSIAAAEKAMKAVVDKSRTLGLESAAGIWGLGVGGEAAKHLHLMFDKCAVKNPNVPNASVVQPMAMQSGECGRASRGFTCGSGIHF